VDAEAQSLKRTLPGAAFLENVLTRPEGPAEVRLRVVVDSDGKVAQMRFESGSVKFFPTAMKIVGGFHYASTLSGGKPVAVETIVDLKFAKGSPRPAGVAGMAGMTGLSPSAEGAPTVFVTPPPGNAPVRISGGILAGMILEKTAPVYPAVARAAHVSGAVVLHAIIAKDGTVKELQVISGPDMLNSAAVDAVKTWRYRPYLLNGNPTEVDTTITVNFNFGAPAPSAAPPPGPEKPQ
jgi:protein TonB